MVPASSSSIRANLGADHRAVVETLAQERRKVAAAFGVRNFPPKRRLDHNVFGSAQKGARPVQQHQNAQQSYVTVLQDH